MEDEPVHLTETESESEEGPGSRYNLQRHDFSDITFPARPCLLESPLLLQRAPQLGARHSTCELMGSTFLTQTITKWERWGGEGRSRETFPVWEESCLGSPFPPQEIQPTIMTLIHFSTITG